MKITTGDMMDAMGGISQQLITEAAAGSREIRERMLLRITMTAASFVLMCAVVSLSVFAAMVNHYLNMIPKVDNNGPEDIIPPGEDYFETDPLPGTDEMTDHDIVPDTAAPVMDPAAVIWPGDPDEDDMSTVMSGGDLLNILIVGQDRRPGEGRQRSDSMMLISINASKKKVSVISFLRDTYVQIPGGYQDNRLNTAYKWGGFPLLKQTLYKNFGVSVDGCFECDFNDFKEIIDLLGGVEVNVTEKEANHLASYFHVTVPSGVTTLSGAQALAYARIRKIDSDFMRTQRQRTILMALFNKFRTASTGDLNEIANLILPKLETDMTNGEILSLLAKLIPIIGTISEDSVAQYSVPYSGTYENATIRKMQVLVPDLVSIRSRIRGEMLPY